MTINHFHPPPPPRVLYCFNLSKKRHDVVLDCKLDWRTRSRARAGRCCSSTTPRGRTSACPRVPRPFCAFSPTSGTPGRWIRMSGRPWFTARPGSVDLGRSAWSTRASCWCVLWLFVRHDDFFVYLDQPLAIPTWLCTGTHFSICNFVEFRIYGMQVLHENLQNHLSFFREKLFN